MNQEIKKQWVEALRSGNYNGARGCLRSDNNSFCVEGILCKIHSKATQTPWNYGKYLGHKYGIPNEVVEWAGLQSQIVNNTNNGGDFGDSIHIKIPNITLDRLNDMGMPFSEIADLIDQHL
jgi:hypothetical protein